MPAKITEQEIARLRAPFPLAAHSIREGNKVRGGQGIQWFVYVEKTEVENRLNEVFPGEWGSSQPVLYPLGNSIAATISITIRDITRGNTGEDSNGTEKAKGATTDAFRRAAADWGIAKYLWEMDFQIYTDAYPDKDWKARDAREAEAFGKFATWFNKKFGKSQASNVLPIPPESNQDATRNDLPLAVGENIQPPQKQPVDRLNNGNGKKTIAPPQKPTNEAPTWKDEIGLVKQAVYAYYKNDKHLEASIAKLEREGVLKPDMTTALAVQVITNHKDKSVPPF